MLLSSKGIAHCIQRLRERFWLLLEQSKSVPVHVRNLQLLITEIYETKCGLNPPFMKDIFMQRNISFSAVKVRHGDDTQLPKVRTTSFGVEFIAHLGNKLWQNLRQEIKQSSSLPNSKKHISCWSGGKCNFRPCKVYIPKVGFLTG